MTAVDHELHGREVIALGEARPSTDADTLATVRDVALQLLSGFPKPPIALRIRVGDVNVEAEWPPSLQDTVHDPVGGAVVPESGTITMPDRDPTTRHVCSPTVGVFYRAPEPRATPFVEVGDRVRVGQQIAIVEAMKLMIPVNADAEGTITEVLKDNDEPVEYGEPLFAYSPVSPRPNIAPAGL